MVVFSFFFSRHDWLERPRQTTYLRKGGCSLSEALQRQRGYVLVIVDLSSKLSIDDADRHYVTLKIAEWSHF
jgi:hypothetical protein